MKGPAAKMSVRQRVKEHETLLKGVATADAMIRAMDAECARQERVIRRLKWAIPGAAVAACALGALLARMVP
jgi:hypothetical protein